MLVYLRTDSLLGVLLVLTSIFIRMSEFFGGFTAAEIRRRIRLAEFFSADIRWTKIRQLIQIFCGGLGSSCNYNLYTVNHKKRDILFLTITLANLNRFL